MRDKSDFTRSMLERLNVRVTGGKKGHRAILSHPSKGCCVAERSSLVVGGKVEDGGDAGYGNIILASWNKTWSRNIGYLAVNVHSNFLWPFNRRHKCLMSIHVLLPRL
jgi:hypothetical protein